MSTGAIPALDIWTQTSQLVAQPLRLRIDPLGSDLLGNRPTVAIDLMKSILQKRKYANVLAYHHHVLVAKSIYLALIPVWWYNNSHPIVTCCVVINAASPIAPRWEP
jgi:hypothetical protein